MTKAKRQKSKIVLGVTGSIAAYRSADLVRRLKEKNFDVTVVMTEDAQRFVTPLTFAALTGKKVVTSMFDKEHDGSVMPHITLAEEADILLISPATANIIAKLACGMADDLLSCVVMATRAKILIAPAMNTHMYENKIVQENCKRLKNSGIKFIDPKKGLLACGTTGTGHIADEDEILKAVLGVSK